MKHSDSCASQDWRIQRKFGTNWKPCMERRMIWEYTSLKMSWCLSNLPISRPWMNFSQSSSTLFYCWSNVKWRRRMINSSSPYSPNLELIIWCLSLHSMWGSSQPRGWKMPSLNAFIESLTSEHDKLVQMGIIRSSGDQALHVSWPKYLKGKGK